MDAIFGVSILVKRCLMPALCLGLFLVEPYRVPHETDDLYINAFACCSERDLLPVFAAR